MAEEIRDCDVSYITTVSKLVDDAVVDVMALRREIRQTAEEEEQSSRTLFYLSIVDVVRDHIENVKASLKSVGFRLVLYCNRYETSISTISLL